MARAKNPIQQLLRPLSKEPFQCYMGTGLHTLGLLNWILEQTGRADVYVSTFSTSDAFLSGFHRLKKKKLIGRSVLLADLKASKKTVQLYKLMSVCFDDVYLAQNHSKIVLVQNDSIRVSVISSQNQTYGDRAECTMVTTSDEAFLQLYTGFASVIDNNAIQLNGLFNTLAERDRTASKGDDELIGDWQPIGI